MLTKLVKHARQWRDYIQRRDNIYLAPKRTYMIPNMSTPLPFNSLKCAALLGVRSLLTNHACAAASATTVRKSIEHPQKLLGVKQFHDIGYEYLISRYSLQASSSARQKKKSWISSKMGPLCAMLWKMPFVSCGSKVPCDAIEEKPFCVELESDCIISPHPRKCRNCGKTLITSMLT